MQIEVFTITDRARLAEALAVRFAVFVDEQHVPAEEEVDVHDRDDRDARHALVREGRVVAAGRFYRAGEQTVQIGRMAVLPAHRGRGIGASLLDALLAEARACGATRASLHAQVDAADFYRKAGFTPVGATFVECDILHQSMEREI